MTANTQNKTTAINDNVPVKQRVRQAVFGMDSAYTQSQPALRIARRITMAGTIIAEGIFNSGRQSLLAQEKTWVDTNPKNIHIIEDIPLEGSGTAKALPHEAQVPDAQIFAIQTSEILPKLLPLFLIVLGFALTSIVTLIYVLAVDRYNDLINVLIPSIMLSGIVLIAMRWKIALWASLFALFLWSGIAAIAKYYGQAIPANQWLITLPIILTIQIIAARYSRSQYIMFAALGCAYIWLAIFTLGSDLTALASGCLVFTLGTAHHRLGKAWGDKGTRFSHHHTIIGWIAAMAGLIWTQHYFVTLGPLGANTVGIGADQSFYWLVGITLGLIAILISSVMRMRHNRLSLLGCLNICVGALVLPLIALEPTILSVIFEPLTSLPATPYFGFALSAVVITVAVGLGMNGLRRGRFIDTVVAGLAICLQFAIVMNPAYFNFDTLIVILLTTLLVLFCELIIARRSILTAPIN